jgi:hypothetical protein
MPTPTFQPLGDDPTTQQIQDYIVKLIRDLNFMLENLDNKNVVNVAGFLATETELMSKNGLVGLSSDGADPTSTRIWAGDVKTGSPNFKVTQAGIMTAVAALFQSAVGYPRVEINSANNLIAAFADPDTYVAFLPSFNTVPAFVLVDNGTTKGFINRGSAVAGTTLGTFDNEPLNLQPSGPLNLQPSGNLQINNVNGFTGSFPVVTSVTFGPTGGGSYTSKTVSVSKGIITSVV